MAYVDHMINSNLVTTRVAAEILHVSVPTIHRWVALGRLTPVAEGDGIRGARWFEEAQVLELAKELEAAS